MHIVLKKGGKNTLGIGYGVDFWKSLPTHIAAYYLYERNGFVLRKYIDWKWDYKMKCSTTIIMYYINVYSMPKRYR